MIKALVVASCLCAIRLSATTASAEESAKDKADAAMTAFQFCAAGKIAALGKAESSEFLVEASTAACREEADAATEAFFNFAKATMHATSQQHGFIAALYAKEMHTRVVQLVVAFKTGE